MSKLRRLQFRIRSLYFRKHQLMHVWYRRMPSVSVRSCLPGSLSAAHCCSLCSGLLRTSILLRIFTSGFSMAAGRCAIIADPSFSMMSIFAIPYTELLLLPRRLICCLRYAGRCRATQWNTSMGLLVYRPDGGTCLACTSPSSIAGTARKSQSQKKNSASR